MNTPPVNEPPRLYRDPQAGIFFGVCAGFADYLAIPAAALRVFLVLLQVIFPSTLLLYLVAAILMPKRPPSYPVRDYLERLKAQSLKADKIEQELKSLEDYITSDDFSIRSRLHRSRHSPK